MNGILIEAGAQVMAMLLMTLIGVFGAWLTVMLNKKYKLGNQTIELANINAAQQQVIAMAKQTVEELQQAIVDDLKESTADGKLTEDEIDMLKNTLTEKTMAKLSKPTIALLTAAAVDVTTLIIGAGDAWLKRLKEGSVDIDA